MEVLSVFRMDAPEPRLLGHIGLEPVSFQYDSAYLKDSEARAVSCSLPLRSEPYTESEIIPYFEGLLPEGAARRAIAAQLGIEPENYLMLLLHYGLETIGDLAITSGSAPHATSTYQPLDEDNLHAIFSNMKGMAEANREARLSLAGAQGKVGLAHAPSLPIDKGWLQPVAGAPSTHILKTGSLPDIPFLEYLCMKAASVCGINAPEIHLLDFGKPVLCVERYDRHSFMDGDRLLVSRLHQEDFSQAFGIPPEAKYRECKPSTAKAVSEFLRLRSSRPIEDLEAFVRITCFNYLIGNCDNHLKNLSILYAPAWKSLRLAPAYDLVSTTRFERFSRTMGMALGSASTIDEVRPVDIVQFGLQVGMDPSDLAELCKVLTKAVLPAIEGASKSARGFDELPYVAWSLEEEMSDRLSVLEQVAHGGR